jgi:hypothetical protein
MDTAQAAIAAQRHAVGEAQRARPLDDDDVRADAADRFHSCSLAVLGKPAGELGGHDATAEYVAFAGLQEADDLGVACPLGSLGGPGNGCIRWVTTCESKY